MEKEIIYYKYYKMKAVAGRKLEAFLKSHFTFQSTFSDNPTCLHVLLPFLSEARSYKPTSFIAQLV